MADIALAASCACARERGHVPTDGMKDVLLSCDAMCKKNEGTAKQVLHPVPVQFSGAFYRSEGVSIGLQHTMSDQVAHHQDP